jgi:hypothetical protein
MIVAFLLVSNSSKNLFVSQSQIHFLELPAQFADILHLLDRLEVPLAIPICVAVIAPLSECKFVIG